MSALQIILIAIVAFLHFYFLILEMFLWTKPKGQKAFGLTPEFAEETKVLAANQGLYNGFLSAGLIWGMLDSNYGIPIAIFFLSCVIIASLYAWYSMKQIRLFFIQGVPAILALVVLHV